MTPRRSMQHEWTDGGTGQSVAAWCKRCGRDFRDGGSSECPGKRRVRDESTPEGRRIWADVDKAAKRAPGYLKHDWTDGGTGQACMAFCRLCGRDYRDGGTALCRPRQMTVDDARTLLRQVSHQLGLPTDDTLFEAIRAVSRDGKRRTVKP